MDYKAIDKWLEEHAADRDEEAGQLWIDRSLLGLTQDEMDNLLAGRDPNYRVNAQIRAQDREDNTREVLKAQMRSRNTKILQQNKMTLRRVLDAIKRESDEGVEPLDRQIFDWRMYLDPEARILATERSELSGKPLRARIKTLSRGDLNDMLLWDIDEDDRERQIHLDNRRAIKALKGLLEGVEGAVTLDDVPPSSDD